MVSSSPDVTVERVTPHHRYGRILSVHHTTPMDFTTFQNNIQWIRALDPEPEVYAQQNALYVDFYSTVTEVAKHNDNLTCVDLYINEQWIAWDDVSQDDLDFYPDELQRFRWIATVE